MEYKVKDLENEISWLQDQLKPTTKVGPTQRTREVIKSTIEIEVQIDDIPIGVVLQTPMVIVEGDIPKSDGDMKRSVI